MSEPIKLNHSAASVADLLKRRLEQDTQWGGPQHDDHHDELDWEEFIDKQLRDCRLSDSSDVWRDRMVDIGALAMAAIEWADRKNKEQE